MRDAMDDHAGLAGARASENDQGSSVKRDRAALSIAQASKQGIA
jgi:hypothetical protein